MAEKKRYYWLKLQHDFFQSKRIKKLRKLAGGDTYTIIYLKMQLKAILNNGVLTYTGIEPTFSEELALDIDEEPENVAVTVNYLLNCGLLETADGTDYLVPYAVSNTGSETAVAQRVRDYRERQKVLHGNADVTQTKRLSNGVKEIGNGEKEIDTEIESDTEKELSQHHPRARENAIQDQALSKVMGFYMEEIARNVPSTTVTTDIQSFVSAMGPEIVLHAMERAAEADKHDWRYVKGILNRYKTSGLDTLEKVMLEEKRFQAGKNKSGTADEYTGDITAGWDLIYGKGAENG